MGNPKGVRRNFEKLEDRRLLAAGLLRQGVPQAEVARQVGVHRQSVSRWAQQLASGGAKALKKAGRAGRKPRLKAADLRRIERGLQRGPEALGYETSLWSAWRVADLIEQECGVRYDPSQAWRIGASCGNWAGVASGPWVGPSSGTKPRFGSGKLSAGWRLKSKRSLRTVLT